MRAGRFDTRVSIRVAVEVNTAGSVATTYPSTAARGTRWAERRPLSARERFTSQQLDAEVDYEFKFRNDAVTRAIIPKDRLLVGSSSDGAWYDITGPFDPEVNRRSAIIVQARRRHL